MKKVSLFTLMTLVCLFAIDAEANDPITSAYTPDGRVEFALSTEQVLISFQSGLTFQEKQAILSSEKNIQQLKADDILPSPEVTIARVQLQAGETIGNLLERLNAKQQIRYANPFLIYEDGTDQGIQDRVIVRLKSRKDYSLITDAIKKFNLTIAERNEFDPLVYVLQTSKQTFGNALDVANALHETGAFDYAEVDFLLLLKRFNTNDPALDYQWSLENTGSSLQYNGTAGIDMKVFNAWGSTTGSSSIKVAILDEGVDLTHPDLVGNMLTGYDGTNQGSGGAPQGDDAHGTACAGIVAATGNNNTGVAGVAYDSKIIPVRIAYSSGQNWVTSNTWIGNSINWAWQTAGADILSNSWGGGSSSSTINNAINGAVNNGRGGLGAPVLFAAGNDNGANSYPATQTNVISVIAMSMCAERKSPSSCDGETWWGSNYGTGADVAAPGVKIYTTDISGADGYGSGDYTATFNGTSSATPNAAGVMALILSASSGLTEAQARVALESTCQKVGSYTYNNGVSGQPNGSWSNDLGYGLVNAEAAVLSVSPQFNNDAGISAVISPSGTICDVSATPEATLRNYGSNALTSVTINSQVDGGATSTYNWTGNLASGSSTNVTLAGITFAGGSHTFDAWTSNPNGNSDQQTGNDQSSSSFSSAYNGVTLTIVLDNYPEETSWSIMDGSTTLASGGTYGSQPDGSTVVESICLPDGCFDFVINDAYGDGICCGYGNGSYVLTDDSDGSTLASGGQFTNSETTNFCVQSTPSLSALIQSSSDVSCNGGSNGSATATASGGTAPYSYSWSNGGSGASITGLSAGTYTVTVTDANSTTAQATATITEPSALTHTGGSNDVNCFGQADGSTYILVGGGTAPYSYAWSNGGTAMTISSLGPGTYSVAVTDANGCTTGDSYTVNEPTLLVANASGTDASCNGSSDGSASASASGGVAPYSYSWSTGATTATATGLSAGGYSVTITDANGCSDFALVTINEPSAISLSTSTTDASCGAATDGGVDLSVSGGAAPYSYIWSNGATTQDLSGVASGSYSVTVTDANGCTAGTSATVNENSTLAVSASSNDADCNGGSTGSASASASGGTAPYSYSWSNGGSTSSITGLSAGSYSVTVTDANGCTANANTTVGEPSVLSVSTSGTDATCGNSDGSAYSSVSGGTAPYSYSWSNGSTSSAASGLAPGSYSLTVTDANGCTANSSILIDEEECGGCTYQTVNSNDFEAGWGIWNDGGNDVALVSNATYANSGTYSIQLRDNSAINSSATTDDIDLSGYSEITVAFSYIAVSMDNSNEDFWLQLSTDGGATFTTIEEWNQSDEFVNNQRYSETVVYTGAFSMNTRLRFICDASGNSDWVYIDDVVISGCFGDVTPTCNDGVQNGDETDVDCGGSSCPACPTCSDGIQNGDETGVDCGGSCAPCNGGGCSYVLHNSNNFDSSWGIWNDGGSDCRRSTNDAAYANSGTRCVRLRDNTSTSTMTTNAQNFSGYDELTVNFSMISEGMESGEDLWLQVSNDGGTTFSTVASWVSGTDFVNQVRISGSAVVTGPFASNSMLRFRNDASDNGDRVYLDDMEIYGCQQPGARFAAIEIVNEEQAQAPGLADLKLFPNPTGGVLNINFNLEKDQNVRMIVSDLTGKVAMDRSFTQIAGPNQLSMDTRELPVGMYVMMISNNDEVISKRFIVQR